MTWQVGIVPLVAVKLAWPQVAPLLAPAVAQSGGRADMRSLFQAIMAEQRTLWTVRSAAGDTVAAFTTHVSSYPTGLRLLSLDFIGGKRMTDWLSNVSDRLDDYVADMDLAGIQHTSERLGWDRVLRNIGWRRAGYSHEKMRR